jgi:prevent-host-death family protein
MIRPNDIVPVSEFKAKMSEHLDRLEQTGRAAFLTVNGKAKAVVLPVSLYDKLAEQIELEETVATIQRSVEQFERGEYRPAEEVFRDIRNAILAKANSEKSSEPSA